MRIKSTLSDVVILVIVAVNILVFVLNVAIVDRLDSLPETTSFDPRSAAPTSALAPLVNATRGFERHTPQGPVVFVGGLSLDDAVPGSAAASSTPRLEDPNTSQATGLDSRPIYFL
jgi:hypothetical protein